MRAFELFEEKKTLYVSRKLKNGEALVKWAKDQGFTECLAPSEMHVTIAYSKSKIEWSDMTSAEKELTVKKKSGKRKIKCFGEDKNAVVLVFDSEELKDRWKEFKDELGASWDFPTYHAHVTITYNGLPEGVKLKDITPYEGPLEFGPERKSEITKDWKGKTKTKKLTESFRLADVDTEELYQTFKKSYEAETGASWSKDKMLERARNWEFFGEPTGFVAIRRQASGMVKLVATAGDFKGIMRGFSELQNEGGPLWGAVSNQLARIAKSRGMIVPHLMPGGPTFIKLMVPMIPAAVFGGFEPKINDDGGMTFEYDDVGAATKYLIGNKEYFKMAIANNNLSSYISKVPGLKQFLALIGL
jgi:hypothetical protein